MADQWIIRVRPKAGRPYNLRFESKEAAQAKATELRAEGCKVLMVRA